MILRGDSFKSDDAADDEGDLEAQLPGEEPSVQTCPVCQGCGAVASDSPSTPWRDIQAALPTDDRLLMAVESGACEPARCVECNGEGVVIADE